VLKCIVCRYKICRDCYELLHKGFECQDYKDMLSWLDVDTTNRKRCPNCSFGILKVGGCPKVVCSYCKIIICWLCLKYSKISSIINLHICRIHWNRR
jgi:uncharacterized Zn-finger protein